MHMISIMYITTNHIYITTFKLRKNYDGKCDQVIKTCCVVVLQTQPELDNVSQFAKGYEDYLQCPLQVCKL